MACLEVGAIATEAESELVRARAAIDTYRDLDGDGRPDAVVTEGGAVCYGDAGSHFWLLTKQAGGSWKQIYEETAMPDFLKSKGNGRLAGYRIGRPRILLRGRALERPDLCPEPLPV